MNESVNKKRRIHGRISRGYRKGQFMKKSAIMLREKRSEKKRLAQVTKTKFNFI